MTDSNNNTTHLFFFNEKILHTAFRHGGINNGGRALKLRVCVFLLAKSWLAAWGSVVTPRANLLNSKREIKAMICMFYLSS